MVILLSSLLLLLPSSFSSSYQKTLCSFSAKRSQHSKQKEAVLVLAKRSRHCAQYWVDRLGNEGITTITASFLCSLLWSEQHVFKRKKKWKKKWIAFLNYCEHGNNRETSIPLLVSSVVPTITRIEQRRYSGNALVTQAIDSILWVVASLCHHERCFSVWVVGITLPTRTTYLLLLED